MKNEPIQCINSSLACVFALVLAGFLARLLSFGSCRYSDGRFHRKEDPERPILQVRREHSQPKTLFMHHGLKCNGLTTCRAKNTIMFIFCLQEYLLDQCHA